MRSYNNDPTNLFAISSASTGGPRPVSNFILSNFETVLGKFIKYYPKPNVRPSTKDEANKLKAEYADMYIQHRYRVDNDELKNVAYCRMLLTYGTAFHKAVFDKSAGRIEPVPKMKTIEQDIYEYRCSACDKVYAQPVPQCEICGNSEILQEPTGKKEEVEVEDGSILKPTGDIQTGVPSPKDIYIDPLSRFYQPGRYMWERQIRHTSWIQNVLGKKIDPEELNELGCIESRLSQYNSDTSQPSKALTAGNIPIYEYYEMPSAEYPNGIFGTMTSKEFLLLDTKRGIPYNDPDRAQKRFPYAAGFYRPSTDRFWGEGLISSLISMQDQINTSDRHRWKYRKRTMTTRFMANSQSNIKTSYMNGDELQAIRYSVVPGAPEPHFLQAPNLPQSLFADRAILIDDMKEISGAKDIVQGSEEGSGRALNIKLENAEDRLRPDLVLLQAAEVDYHMLKLVIAQEFAADGEMVKAMGSDGNYNYYQFKKADLDGKFDIHVDMATTLSRSFALRMSNIYDLADRMFIDPRNPKVAYKVLRMLGMEELMPEYSTIAKRAAMENELLREGKQVHVMPFDNHNAHLAAHLELYNSNWYYELEETDPCKQLVIMHLQEHFQQRQRQEMLELRKMEAQAALQGGGKGGGKGGGDKGGNVIREGVPLQEAQGNGIEGEPPAGSAGQQQGGVP